MQTCPDCGVESSDEELYCVGCGRPLDPEDRQSSFIGKTIEGNFLLEEILGEGAMGTVYKATQLSLDKTVALKILHRHLAGEKNMARRFKREARAASRLNHPNSLHIIDFGQHDKETLYIAMEYIEGCDLYDVLDDWPLPLERIVALMGQVCDALEEAHAAGIVHRDLKPENIMVVRQRDGREGVKVCDFGIAKIQDHKAGESAAPITVAGIVCGTPEYMSPEQGKGEQLDGRADLYSAGVILYQLATEELPFSADTALGVVTRQLTEDPVPPTQAAPNSPVAAALENVILRAMAKNPDDRYQTALELKEDLVRVGAGEQIAPFVPTGVPTAAVVPPHRPRWPAILAAAVGAAVAVSGVAWVLGLGRSEGPIEPTRVVFTDPAAVDGAPTTAPDPLGDGSATYPGDGGNGPSADGAPRADGAVDAPRGKARPRPRPRDPRPRHLPGKAGAPAPGEAPPTPEKAPDDPPQPTSFARGMKAFRAGQIDVAIREFEQTRSERPAKASVHRMLGKCYYRVGRIDRGRAAYRRYLELRPDAQDREYIQAIIGG